MSSHRLSIIIPTLNEEKNIPRILNNLKQQTFQNFELIIVDSNSKDNTRKITKNLLKELKFKKSKTYNLGFAKGPAYGRNKGAELASNNEILFLDCDTTLPSKDFLEKMLRIKKEKEIGVAAFLIKSSKDSKTITKLGYSLNNLGLRITQHISPTAIGACLSSTKKVHKKIKGFDQRITVCEDCAYVKKASKISKFKVIPLKFYFDDRRLRKEGALKLQIKYLKANLQFLRKENKRKEVSYSWGEY